MQKCLSPAIQMPHVRPQVEAQPILLSTAWSCLKETCTDSRPLWREGPCHIVQAPWSHPMVHQPTKGKPESCSQVGMHR